MAKVETIRLVELGDDRSVAGNEVLKIAKRQKLDEVFVVGRSGQKGELWCRSSLNAGQTLWLLEKARERIMDGNPWSVV